MSEGEQENIVNRFLSIRDKCGNEGARQGWINKKLQMTRVYDQKRESKVTTLGDWTFMHVPIPTMIVDKVRNNIYNAINTRKVINMVGVDRGDKKFDRRLTGFLNHIITTKTEYKKTLDSAIKDMLVCGVGIVETPWKEEISTRFLPDENGNFSITELITQGPDVRYLNPEDVIFTPDIRYAGVQNCTAILVSRKVSYTDLVEGVERGEYLNVDPSAVLDEKTSRAINKNSELVKEADEASGYSVDGITDEYFEQADVLEVVAKFKYRDMSVTDWRFWITPNNKKLIRWHVSTLPIRPIVLLNSEPTGSGIYARSLMEVLDGISIEMDTIFNNILQAGHISVMPPFFYDSNETDFKPQEHTWGPLQFIPIRDPSRSVKQAEIRTNMVENLALFNQLFSLAQSLTSISDYALGGGGQETATGVNALTRATISNLQATMGRIVDSCREIAENVFALIRVFAPEEYFRAYSPEFGIEMFDKVNIFSKGAQTDWDFEFVPELEQSSDIRRNEYNQLFNIAMPVLMNFLASGSMPDGAYYMLRELFMQYDKEELVENVLGPARDGKAGELRGYPPEIENVMLLQGDSPVADLDDDHEAHMAAHNMLISSREYAAMDESDKGLVTRHIQEHQQFMAAAQEIGGNALNIPNMTQPSATNVVPTPEFQQGANAQELAGRISQGDEMRLGANE